MLSIRLYPYRFDIMDKYAQFMDLDESNNMKKIHEGDKSTLKIGWQFVTASPFDDIDSLINELTRFVINYVKIKLLFLIRIKLKEAKNSIIIY